MYAGEQERTFVSDKIHPLELACPIRAQFG